ncbi:MAG: hypothetical protein ACRD3V_27785, partial [Vicinamibacteria bacterium]
MLRSASLLLAITAAAPLVLGAQEILFLKNGRQIAVDRYWEDGDQIYYEKNGSTVGFPKHLLD